MLDFKRFYPKFIPAIFMQNVNIQKNKGQQQKHKSNGFKNHSKYQSVFHLNFLKIK